MKYSEEGIRTSEPRPLDRRLLDRLLLLRYRQLVHKARERSHQIDWHREDYSGVFVCSNLNERLQISKLNGDRLFLDLVRGHAQLLRGH